MTELTDSQKKIVAFLKDYRVICERHWAYVTGIVGAEAAVDQLTFPDTSDHKLYKQRIERHIVGLIEEEYEEGGMKKLKANMKQEMFLEVYPERRK